MQKHVMLATSMAAIEAARPQAIIGGVRADSGDDHPEVMLKKVSQQLDALNGEIKQTAEDALKQAKTAGEVSSETKATVDKLLAAQTEAGKVVDSLKELVEGVDGKVLDLSQQVAQGGTGRKSRPMTLGQGLVAQEESYKNYKSGELNLTVSNAVTTEDGSGGGLIYHEEERVPVPFPRRMLKVRSLLTQAMTSSDQIHYRKQETRDNKAGMVKETEASVASDVGWRKAVERVKKIGTHINISEETLQDADQLQSEIDSELMYFINFEEEEQILHGDPTKFGQEEDLTGLMTEAPDFVAAVDLPNVNRIDRLRLALLQVTLENYMPMEIILNPTDWAAIQLIKVGGDDHRYLYGNPHGPAMMPMLWGKMVCESHSMSVGEWLVGDLPMAATFYDRRETELTMSTSNDEDFIKDMITIKARKRVALAIKRAKAMVKGDFTFTP